MSILIKGMEMPTRCCECRLSTCHSFKERPLCDVLVEYMSYGEWETKRLDNCPLIPVPPHGRLIDADALEDNNITYYAIPVLANVTDGTIREAELVIRLKDLDAAPTIIPAEEGET